MLSKFAAGAQKKFVVTYRLNLTHFDCGITLYSNINALSIKK